MAQNMNNAQKMKFSIKDFLSKCNQIRRKLQICSHILEKSLMENFIFFVQRELHTQNHTDTYIWYLKTVASSKK